MLTVRMSSLPNDVYWQERAAMRQEIYNRADNSMLQQLGKAYQDAQGEISAEMQRLIGSYARRTGDVVPGCRVDPSGACAPQAETEAAEEALMDALEDSPAKMSIRARLNAESVRFRLNEPFGTAGEREHHLCEAGAAGTGTRDDKPCARLAKTLICAPPSTCRRERRSAGTHPGFSERQLTQMLKDKWTGVSYSDRLWNNTEKLSQMVSREMASGLMGGKDHDRIIRDLMKTFDVSRYVAARLVVTETAYVANHSELRSYIDSGVEEYQFVAIFDEKTSDVCRAHSSKVYRVADAKPGVNLPPLHPWCRSTTIPVYGRDWLATVNRSVKKGDGKYILIPAKWNYDQWQRWQGAGCPPITA